MNKIKNAEVLDKTLFEEYDIYHKLSYKIINFIIDKNFTSNQYLKDELILQKNIIHNVNKEISYINIENVLSNREITEIDDLKILSTELYDVLSKYNQYFIIIIEYKLIKFIKSLINKEKIHNKIYFVSDFNKPISYMINEFISILD